MKNKVLMLLVLAMLVVGVAPVSFGAPPIGKENDQGEPKLQGVVDDKPDPLTLRQRDLRKKALEAKLNGKAHGRTHRVARGQYVELEREGEGMIWTVLGEFADLVHNTLPEPDRTVDNTTIWVPDFSRNYYTRLLFNDAPRANSMRKYYIEQSSNRYTVDGDVTDWIRVPKQRSVLR